MNWILFVTVILGGESYQQPVRFFDSEKECSAYLPSDQQVKQNLQVVGKCYEIVPEVEQECAE